MSVNYENRIALNPALIVGLGGTGKKALMNFKETFLTSPQIRRAYEQSGQTETSLPDFIDLLCIDTDIFDANQPEKEEEKSAVKLSESEYHQINIQNAGQITNNLDTDTYGYLYEWFPQKLKTHIGQISQGAHQFRFTGRFGVFVDVQKIFMLLKSKISKIMARGNVNQEDIIVPLTNKQGQILTPEFYVVGSMCGGSGAGMFMDMAYLLKMAYYQLSGGKGKPSIIGIELTPEAFTQIAIDPNVNSTGRIEGNGYASLAETYYFMNKEKFPPTQSAKDIIAQDRRNKFMVNYGPIGKSNDTTTFGTVAEEPPFDQCYLLGTSNMDDIQTYYAIASELIFTKLATQLRQAQNSMLDNASQILGQFSSDLEGKQLKCFSSAGFKSFYYPLDIIRELYTYKLSMDVNYWLKLSKDRILLDAMVQEFAENNPSVLDLTPEGLLALSKDIIKRKEYWDNPRFHTVKVSNKQKENESGSAFILRQIQETDSDRVKKDDIRAQVRIKFEEAAKKAAEGVKDLFKATQWTPPKPKEPAVVSPLRENGKIELIAIGISTGGPNALREVFKDLDKNIKQPVLVVQHMPAGFTAEFAHSLDMICPLPVTEAKDGEPLMGGHVYIAPGGSHMIVEHHALANNIRITQTDPRNGHRPSVDVLFESIAEIFQNRALGVIMTGMGKDGAAMLAQMRKKGAWTLGQDSASSIVYGMPKVAYELGAVMYQEELGKIPKKILECIKKL